MMSHHTKDKGDIAVVITIADLTKKGFVVFTPVVSEHLPFDLIAYKDGTLYRIQVKYSKDGFVRNKTSWSDTHGYHKKEYDKNDFDYYAIYIQSANIILYPSIKFGGIRISTELGNSSNSFYWWEDFINFTDEVKKKKLNDFDIKINTRLKNLSVNGKKVLNSDVMPNKEELQSLIWQKPMTQLAKDFGVSQSLISKWVKIYNLNKPAPGYWNKISI